MTTFILTYTPDGNQAHSARLSNGELELVVQAARVPVDVSPPSPHVSGDRTLATNLALVALLSAWLHAESQARRTRSDEKKAAHRAHAKQLQSEAGRLARLVVEVGDGLHTGWCSICLYRTFHRGADGPGLDTYICESCGSATTPCVVPGCRHYARRGSRRVTTPRYCAEHLHDVPSFERIDARLDSLEDWERWHEFDSRNARKLTKAGAAGVAVAVAGALTMGAAAPAIGGAIGHTVSLVGSGATLSGAAASSYGLALLGAGSLAAGGLGMAGGAAVITAVGGVLGAHGGLRLATAYGNEDDSFDIQPVRSGRGAPVLVATGFTTERQEHIEDWYPLIDSRYAGRPVHYVRWGAKEKRDLARWVGGGGTAVASKRLAGMVAKKATRTAGTALTAAMGPLGVVAVATNPWTVAYQRAIKTGYALAEVLARLDAGPPVLLGHSLGGRAMVAASTFMGTNHPGQIEAVHVLGAAVPTDEKWRWANEAVTERVYNYWSRNDSVLNTHFRIGQYGKPAIGQVGTGTKFKRIKDVNVSRSVDNHGAYMTAVSGLKGP